MQLFYYKDDRLTYASRKRYINIPIPYFSEETQKKVSINDGARTTIKTSSNNLCDYVIMVDKNDKKYRWFVIAYEYLNSEQIILHLQRDVIGEGGISLLGSAFGKIERGYTETVLRNRKELSLNQQLQKRIPLKPNSNVHGNFTITPTNNVDEVWGILYFVKPKPDEIEGNTFNIPISSFSPKYNNNITVSQNTEYILKNSIKTELRERILIGIEYKENFKTVDEIYLINIGYDCDFTNNKYIIKNANITLKESSKNTGFVNINKSTIKINIDHDFGFSILDNSEKFCYDLLNTFISLHANSVIENNTSLILPDLSSFNIEDVDYSGENIKYSGNIYTILSDKNTNVNKGGLTNNSNGIINDLISLLRSVNISSFIKYPYFVSVANPDTYFKFSDNIYCTTVKYLFNLIDNYSGDIVIDLTKSLIDEPYYLLVFPLFDCTISGYNKQSQLVSYSISRDNAFHIFNEIISYLSGETPFIVDAQIIPYCPDLDEVSCELDDNNNKYPVFNVISNSFYIKCNVSADDLGIDYDVKKEYIKKHYSIISPEKTGKFDFNYYDYFVSRRDFTITIKIALKPFAVISSAVIDRDTNSLVGNVFETDLMGCQPSSNGFECSLSSNAFETYRRQNANYQQIFALQQQEMQKQHGVERVNEVVSGVVNTLSIGAMGAIAGASLADAGIGSLFGTRSVGAAVGAATSSAVVGGAMTAQYLINEDLRKYEEYLLKERFNLEIGTIKALPNSINRIASFNEIILREFYFVIEVYKCTIDEEAIVENFINNYAYGIGVYDLFSIYCSYGKFLRGDVITSNLITSLHNILKNELGGGIYLYEQV